MTDPDAPPAIDTEDVETPYPALLAIGVAAALEQSPADVDPVDVAVLQRLGYVNQSDDPRWWFPTEEGAVAIADWMFAEIAAGRMPRPTSAGPAELRRADVQRVALAALKEADERETSLSSVLGDAEHGVSVHFVKGTLTRTRIAVEGALQDAGYRVTEMTIKRTWRTSADYLVVRLPAARPGPGVTSPDVPGADTSR